ncbi:hypothetical protein DV515_00007138 [Chloebia gouldiae]|uniref:Uncharacterized protein n=1 Tax=Chloebia gouldiae TaxID=44316 RepID=A0A3L8SI58_CHLGU|nr:hypothetical protein DV515_00007138 [Chloebia gouldiae]
MSARRVERRSRSTLQSHLQGLWDRSTYLSSVSSENRRAGRELRLFLLRLGFLSLPCSASSVQTVAKPPNILYAQQIPQSVEVGWQLPCEDFGCGRPNFLMGAQVAAALGVEAVQWYTNTQHCGEQNLCWGLSAGPRERPQQCPVVLQCPVLLCKKCSALLQLPELLLQSLPHHAADKEPPRGEEAGARHSMWCKEGADVKVSQWERGRYERADCWWRYSPEGKRKKGARNSGGLRGE